MKKTLKNLIKIALLVTFTLLILPQPTALGITVDVNDLLYKTADKFTTTGDGALTPETAPGEFAVKALPENVTMFTAITTIVKTILKAAMYITMVGIIVAAGYYMAALGEDEKITKAKAILANLVIGMMVIAASYGIVTGISQFNFFQ